MGELKKLLDREFKHLDRDFDVESANYSQKMDLFARLLRGAEEIDRADFHSAVDYAVNHFKLPTSAIKGGVPLPEGVISRYLHGHAAPAHFRRADFLQNIARYAQKESRRINI